MRLLLGFTASFVVVCAAPLWAQNNAAFVNLDPAQAPALAAGAKAAGLATVATTADGASQDARVIVWQAENKPSGDITEAREKQLEAFVRNGGSLLLTFSQNPGSGPYRLSPILPTMAWETVNSHYLKRDAAPVAESETAFFGAKVSGEVPYFFEMRPFHAVERGESRYSAFQRPLAHLEPMELEPNNNWWTRSLLNRDWQIRARAGDFAQSPLLLTGQYGAGRVAVWASDAAGLADVAAWTATFQWLSQKAPLAAPALANFPPPTTRTHAAKSALNAEISNPTGAVLPLQVVARLLTWEGAPIGDVTREITLPANGRANVEIPLPTPGPTNYQALEARDAFIVRLGVLSGDGRQLLSETRVTADLRPALRITLQTDEERTRTYPFDAPPVGKDFRLGIQLPAYAFKPGASVNARVELSNGLQNLAPQATVSDLTTPDNASVMALNDGAVVAEHGPSPDNVEAWGTWTNTAKADRVLRWQWKSPVTIAAVVLVGAADQYRNQDRFNPPIVIVSVGGREVARDEKATSGFLAGEGRLRLTFAPVMTQELEIRLPWQYKDEAGHVQAQNQVTLGEVEVQGALGENPDFAAQKGAVSLLLQDSLSGKTTEIGRREVTVAPLARENLSFPLTLPAGTGANFYRIEARYLASDVRADQTALSGVLPRSEDAPVLSIDPIAPLQPMSAFKPDDAPQIGFIVTRGFRNIFDNAVGTAEIGPGWGQPDDLVWAYAHGFKQNGAGLRDQPGRLYVSENDMRHYSTPWRQFPDGEEFYDVAAPLLVERYRELRGWDTSKYAILAHSDRWDTGPPVGSLNSWQDFEGFNDYLLAHKIGPLTARTLDTIAAEIAQKYPNQWQAWNLERYVHDIRTLRDDFAKAGKQLVITAQGVPLIPPAYQAELSQVIKGMSDDVTWGLDSEDVPLTTGRQMGILAFDSDWKMSTLIQWGWDSAELENQHWHAPVGTTEPSRRAIYDRAFRGVVRSDGTYSAMSAYGYNFNGGFAYTMNANDYTQWSRVQEKHSLLTPDAPIGAGLVLSNSRLNDPKSAAFDGAMDFSRPGLEGIGWTQTALRRLHEGGLSVPFTTNAANLRNWKGTTPVVAVNLWEWSDDEVAQLQKLAARGVAVAALGLPENQQLSARAAALFGVTPSGTALAGKSIAKVDGRDVVQNGKFVFAPFFAGSLTPEEGNALAPVLRDALGVPIGFPAGTAGYGFRSNGRQFVVVEDWREEGRIVPLRFRSNAATLRAANTNNSTALTTHRDGADWVIDVPLRPGDGELIAIEEGE